MQNDDRDLIESPDYFKLEVKIKPGEEWNDPRTGRVYLNRGDRPVRF